MKFEEAATHLRHMTRRPEIAPFDRRAITTVLKHADRWRQATSELAVQASDLAQLIDEVSDSVKRGQDD